MADQAVSRFIDISEGAHHDPATIVRYRGMALNDNRVICMLLSAKW